MVLTGSKQFRVDYFEATGNAQITFNVSLISSSEAWQAIYYKDKFGTQVLARGEPRSGSRQLDYNWGRGSPADGIPVDWFSARWIGTFNFEGGDYKFHATVDDGVRVYIDGILLIDQWTNGFHNDITNTFLGLGAGNHQVTVEYYETQGDALIQVWWERVTGDGGGGGGAILAVHARNSPNLLEASRIL